jgi:hypothetical protein
MSNDRRIKARIKLLRPIAQGGMIRDPNGGWMIATAAQLAQSEIHFLEGLLR